MTSSKPATPQVRQLIVIGLGLIGGSLAKAAKERGVCSKVIGVVRREEVCQQAIELGVVDQATTNLQDIVPSMAPGDVIFIAVPTLSMGKVIAEVAQSVPDCVTVTDGASVKGSVLRDVQAVYGVMPPQFVLGHPIAGSEKSGVDAANAELYVKHRIILTPTEETGVDHLQRVTQLWQAVGAEVLHLGVIDHDEILGATSHLPHAIAFSLVDTLAHDSKNENIFRYAAGGFRDFTRIASSDAVMWRDIMLANKESVISAIDLFSNNLSRLRNAIEKEDGHELLGVFTRAKAARDHFSAMLERRAYLSQNKLEKIHFRVGKTTEVGGETLLPGDKSISHRAVLLAALAEGRSTLHGYMEGEDAYATIQACRDMGVVIEGPDDGRVCIDGVGLHGLKSPSGSVYVGNAGTSMRLLCGLLAAQSFDSEITTDLYLAEVSLEPVLDPLLKMGARVAVDDGSTPPVKFFGNKPLTAIAYVLPDASAQVKSSTLLAALYARGTTMLTEQNPSRDHTERLLSAFGCSLNHSGPVISIAGGQHLTACDIDIPGDFSSAVVLIAAAGLAEKADLTLKKVGLNPTRTAALDLLRGFGLNLDVADVDDRCAEPFGTVRVRTTEQLVAQSADVSQLASLADEFPVLMAVAAVAPGKTCFRGLGSAIINRKKRVQRMITCLRQLGIECELLSDSLVIQGGTVSGGQVDAENDHRLALALSLLGIRASDPIEVQHCATVATSFPSFLQTAKKVGISIEAIGH